MANPKKNELEQTAGGGSVTQFDPELAAMLTADSGMGKENITTADMAIPRLTILQPLSPQVTPGKAEYNETAKPGMIYDSVMNKFYSGASGLISLPVHFRSAYLEWIPRSAGGGFVADHGSDSSILTRTKVDPATKANLTAEGHEVILTAEYFCYLLNPEGVSQAIISMAKTQHRKARVWNTLINQFEIPNPADPSQKINPAMFYRTYHLTTVLETNDKGSWFGWKIEPDKNTLDLPGGRELYLRARKFHADIAAGAVKVAPPVEQQPVENEDAPM